MPHFGKKNDVCKSRKYDKCYGLDYEDSDEGERKIKDEFLEPIL